MDINTIKLFRDDIEARQWDKVRTFLVNILEHTPCEAFDSINPGGEAALALWVNVLYCTGLYKDSPKGRHLFLKIISALWAGADSSRQWDMLCYVACIYKRSPDDLKSANACLAYFHELAGTTGICINNLIDIVILHKNAMQDNFSKSSVVQ